VGQPKFTDNVLFAVHAKKADVITAAQFAPVRYAACVNAEKRGNEGLQFVFNCHWLLPYRQNIKLVYRGVIEKGLFLERLRDTSQINNL